MLLGGHFYIAANTLHDVNHAEHVSLDVLGYQRDLESGNRLKLRSVKFYKSPRLRTALYYYG